MKSSSGFIYALANIQKFRELLDLPSRILFKLRNELKENKSEKSSNELIKSDSENLEYAHYVSEVVQDKDKLKKFRRPYKYRQILEHVNWVNGERYLDRYFTLGGSKEDLMKLSAEDWVGKPRKYFYPGYGWLSTTQIRYLAVREEMRGIFNFEEIETIGEIGCGFGGQFLSLSHLETIKTYSFYDLIDVQRIIQYYLSNFAFSTKTLFPEVSKIEAKKFDLVISNYAFSELPRIIQLEYVEKILSNSVRGYMIMNSGLNNETRRNNGKLSLSEIRALMPWINTLAEVPLTGPDNYVIYWDRSKG